MTFIKKQALLALLVFTVSGGLSQILPSNASAVSGSDWQAGNIASDTVFFNSGSMTAAQIQAFLNAKVPTCDTNGTGTTSSGQSRAAYSAANGHPAPFTCLKDYSQTTTSKPAEDGLCNAYTGSLQTSAQIIYSVSQACGINPQVLLVLLQKEQSLVTDDWPWDVQYQSATGYGCPDTAACDSTYYGFFNQVYNAARQYKLYQKNASSYSYRAGRTSTILYNPTSSCGSTSVYLQGQATAGLYNYTPYQPNAAALGNLYGSGDSCSSYGNRNFWRLFSDWFGSTVDPDANFSVTNSNPVTGVTTWYLITPTGRYGIPDMTTYNAWGLGSYAFQSADAGYFSSLNDGGVLGRVLKDKFGNFFVMDNGQAHYVRDQSYLSLWGLSNSSVVQSTGLVYAKQGGAWIGRFMQDATSGQWWLIDGGAKHAVDPTNSMLYQWGYTSDQLTPTTSDYINTMPNGGALSRYVVNNGTNYLIDADRAIKLDNPVTRSALNPSGTYTTLTSATTLSYLQQGSTTGVFVQNSDTGGWYLVGAGKKYYIPNLQTAQNWGYIQGTSILHVSGDLMGTLTDGGSLSSVVKDGAGNIWTVDGQKHRVDDSAKDAWTSASMVTMDDTTLSTLPTGSPVGRYIKPDTSAYVYVMVDGVKHYLTSTDVQRAWGANTVTTLSSRLVYTLPEGSFTTQVVRSQAGTDYVLDGITAYPVTSSLAQNYEGQTPPVVVSNAQLGLYTTSSISLGLYFNYSGTTYLVNNNAALPLQTYADTYTVPQSIPYLAIMPFGVQNQVSYLVNSNDSSSSTIWFVNLGSKIAFPSFAEAANYGYVSRSQPVTTLTPSVLAAIPTSTSVPSLLIQKPNAGIKLLSFGYALGFPDGDTLSRYVSGTNPVLTVAPSVYDSFGLKRTTSKLIRSDNGMVYVVENGTKRWISNLNTTPYTSVPQTYLEGTTMIDIPTGTPYN